MILLDAPQGSDEWRKARAGSLGASSLHEVVAKTKSGWSASRSNKMATLIVERLTGEPQDTYQNAAMLHGVTTEPEARAAYAFRADVDVQEVGLVRHPSIVGTHASPDGLVGNDGLIEIKCPQPAAHLAVLMGEAIPQKYILQMLWQMNCCKRSWCDFVSYSPAFPEHMRIFIKRVERDDKFIAETEANVVAFLAELDSKLSELTSRYALKEAA